MRRTRVVRLSWVALAVALVSMLAEALVSMAFMSAMRLV